MDINTKISPCGRFSDADLLQGIQVRIVGLKDGRALIGSGVATVKVAAGHVPSISNAHALQNGRIIPLMSAPGADGCRGKVAWDWPALAEASAAFEAYEITIGINALQADLEYGDPPVWGTSTNVAGSEGAFIDSLIEGLDFLFEELSTC